MANIPLVMSQQCLFILTVCETTGRTRCKLSLLLWTAQQTLENSLKPVVCHYFFFFITKCEWQKFVYSSVKTTYVNHVACKGKRVCCPHAKWKAFAED